MGVDCPHNRMPSSHTSSCKLCGDASLQEFTEYSDLPRVTSDCKPWVAGGRMAICMACGAVQKVADEKWFAEAAAIYRDYEIYHQSAGIEQGVFDPESGVSSRRSQRLADFLDDRLLLPAIDYSDAGLYAVNVQSGSNQTRLPGAIVLVLEDRKSVV